MKRTFNITESELRNIIRNIVTEETEAEKQRRDAKFAQANSDPNLEPRNDDYVQMYGDDWQTPYNISNSWWEHDHKPIAASAQDDDKFISADEVPDDIDYAIGQNNAKMDNYDNIAQQARDKWVGGESPDYMEGWTMGRMSESKLRDIVKESVKRILKEGHYNQKV